MPTFWSIPDYNVFNIIQSDRKNGVETDYWLLNSNVERIIAFDGMWFCIRKSLFNIIHFDESYYEGFHFYDLDIAMQIHNCQYQIMAIPKIIIEHTSRGNIDKNWLINAFKFYDKWELSLPISFVNNDQQIPTNIEDAAIISLLRMIRIEKAYLLLIPWYRASISVKGGFFNLVNLIVNFNIQLLRKKAKNVS